MRNAALCCALTAVAGARSHGPASPRQQVGELSREEVIQWHNTLYESTNVLSAPGGGSSALRGWAMVALGMFEASNAVDQRYTPYFAADVFNVPRGIQVASREGVTQRIAVARAAQVVLDGLFAPPPSEPANPLGPMRRFAHAQQFAIQTAAIDPDEPAYIAGMELGTLIGDQILSDRVGDGHPPQDTPVVNGSQWYEYQYDLPYFPGPAQSAGYPGVRPFGVPAFGLDGGEVTYVAPPLPRSSSEFAAQWEETFSYGTSDPSRSRRTPETDATAAFHDGNFGSQIGDIIDVLASAAPDALPAGTDLLRILALTAMSCNDAHSNHWFWKYFYLVGRPITQYRQVPVDQADGLGEQRDEEWGGASSMELVTNQNPEHPSGHASRTNALTASFRAAFGDDMKFRTISYSQPSAPARAYDSFTSFEEEVMASRTYGGVHWRESGFAGQDMARRVTSYIWGRHLLPIESGTPAV